MTSIQVAPLQARNTLSSAAFASVFSSRYFTIMGAATWRCAARQVNGQIAGVNRDG